MNGEQDTIIAGKARRKRRGVARVFAAALLLAPIGVSVAAPADGPSDGRVITITIPMPPPEWALLERALLRANAAACEEFYNRYFDDRGYLLCVERWGGDDGPDDAIECVADWPLLVALGGSERVLSLYKRAWEGHLRQYTLAKTVEVEFARDGMYYKEFPVTFDWVHNGEGLTAFINEGLADPHDEKFQTRVRRFAGFYTGEDPGAANYDPRHKIIRSLFNGSRGPLLRKATGLDWAGDKIDVEGRFQLRHGEHSYAEMLAHFRDYNDIVGDHPQNLCATSLPLAAYMLFHDVKYRDWLLGYVDAWVERMAANSGIIPTNIGLDGTIGGECGGRWYGGVYGWGFSVMDPARGQIAHRNMHALGLVGFGNATLLSGSQRYADAWRTQIEAVNAAGREIDGRMMYPTMHGDQGWYAFQPSKYSHGAEEVYYWSMKPADRERLSAGGWMAFLEGREPGYPAAALRGDFAALRGRVEAMRQDTTTPDTRLADDPLMVSPATVVTLCNLTLGGLYPGHHASHLHARVRYFDPETRRAGLPEGVAALVERLSADSVTVTLVNVDPVRPRSVIVQGGAYGEHEIATAAVGDREVRVDRPWVSVRLEPGCGGQLVLAAKRYVNRPTLAQPWDE